VIADVGSHSDMVFLKTLFRKRGPDDEAVCPVCFATYPKSEIDWARPTCAGCDSEGMEMEVVPLVEFLSRNSVTGLESILQKWEEASGFLSTYKKAKADRIRMLIRMKKRTQQ